MEYKKDFIDIIRKKCKCGKYYKIETNTNYKINFIFEKKYNPAIIINILESHFYYKCVCNKKENIKFNNKIINKLLKLNLKYGKRKRCLNLGHEFYIMDKRDRHCSNSCKKEIKFDNIYRLKCMNCSNIFYNKRYKKYCSRACLGKTKYKRLKKNRI